MKISSFGEVLWDDFPGGKALGGAPLNVLVRLASFGADCSIISRRGRDADGEELLRQIAARNVAADLVQTDEEHATSLVKVLLKPDGSASYNIIYPCAWDKICATEAALARVAESDVLVYGSLSGRDPVSRAALEQILPAARFRVLDVNLRKPHYEPERVLSLMRHADLTDTAHICITLGQHGAVYFRHGKILAHHGFRVSMADSVGAGDSFLAGFLFQMLSGASPEDTLAFACAIGALNVTRHGAVPDISLAEIQALMHPE